MLGVSDELAAEFASSQPAAFNAMNKGLPGLPSKAFRWIGEMEEIATTFDGAGVTPFFHKDAAEMYRLMSDTPFRERDARNYRQGSNARRDHRRTGRTSGGPGPGK